jgi:hypothetical protein
MVNNYHTTPCNYPEDHRLHQHRGGSLKSKHNIFDKFYLCRKNSARDLNTFVSPCKVPEIFVTFNITGNFWPIFNKCPQYKTSQKIRPDALELFYAGRRTDKINPTVAFRNLQKCLKLCRACEQRRIFCKTLTSVWERMKINQACTGNERRSRNFAQ